ncbi:Tat pathway signal protein, partial [candidate division KSB1 bacterium]|nr:Tat pathway signal protein [candidate division KSB1 bacterium]
IAAWAVGAERGWITRDEAVERTYRALKFFWNSNQSKAKDATGYRGFYYHFLDMKTGKRTWNCELSTVDTAWLLGGIRFAAQYYDNADSLEQEIRRLADLMTFRVEWDWATFPEGGDYGQTVAMGWKPEEGFSKLGWTGYNEALFLYIVAAGSNYEGAERAYKRWLAYYDWKEPYPELGHVIFMPLFGHQYSHIFVDFRGLYDTYMREKGIDYFENSRRATMAQQRYAIDNPMGWAGYDSLTWGLTACDGPGPKYNTGDRRFNAYAARGTSGVGLTHDDDGTIAPTAAGGSVVFAPELCIPTLMAMKERYGDQGLWGRHGFLDSFNPTLDWYNKDYLGIDQGPILLMIENLRSGLIWKYSMRDPVILRGLKRLGFRR